MRGEGGGGVRGPVHTVVCGPGPSGGPWTGSQCFRVTREEMSPFQVVPFAISETFDLIFP